MVLDMSVTSSLCTSFQSETYTVAIGGFENSARGGGWVEGEIKGEIFARLVCR